MSRALRDRDELAIFVFSDDLLVFSSTHEAIRYFEPPDAESIQAVFDQTGNKFQVRGPWLEIRPCEPADNRREELLARIRGHVLKVAERHPDLATEDWASKAPEHELIQWCLKFCAADQSRPGLMGSVAGILIGILFSIVALPFAVAILAAIAISSLIRFGMRQVRRLEIGR